MSSRGQRAPTAQDIRSIGATFATAPRRAPVSGNTNGVGLIRVCWPGGTNSSSTDCNTSPTNSNHSGYLFATASTPITPVAGNPFAFDTFTHYNRLISGTTLNTVELMLTFTIAGAMPSSFSDSRTLTHEETPNSGTCAYPIGDHKCPDKVTFKLTTGSVPTAFDYGGSMYQVTRSASGTPPWRRRWIRQACRWLTRAGNPRDYHRRNDVAGEPADQRRAPERRERSPGPRH